MKTLTMMDMEQITLKTIPYCRYNLFFYINNNDISKYHFSD